MTSQSKPTARKINRAMQVAGFLLSGFVLAAAPVMAADTSGAVADTNLSAADDAQTVQFVLALGLRNKDQLQRELKEMYDRSSPHYRHFLSAADFIAKYGPSKDDYAALKKYAASHGLKIAHEHASRTMVSVEGNTATIRDLFKSKMYWRQDKQGKRYLASDVAPTVPAELSSLGVAVVGLNQKPLMPTVQRSVAPVEKPAAATSGSGPGGAWVPNDIRMAYDLIGIQNGGQPVAIVELSNGNYADAAVYASTFGLRTPTITQITVDGGATDDANAVEVMLDIEMAMAVSNPANIYVYNAPIGFTPSLDAFTQIADDDLVGVVSTSWGLCEATQGQDGVNLENTVFTQMAAEGIAVFASAGNFSAYDCEGVTPGVADPASQPYVTGVGGTSLTATSAQTYVSESVWNESLAEGSGGGVSMYWPIPSYQASVTPKPNSTTGTIQFSQTMRNVPDVSLFANTNPGVYVYCNVCNGADGPGWGGPGWGVYGGLSVATPLWAGFWSLVNQGLTVNAGTPVRAGFANPILYAIGENASEYAQSFHDVATGNNNVFYAAPGYDPVSGWGSYNGAALYEQIVGPGSKKVSITPVLNLLLKPSK